MAFLAARPISTIEADLGQDVVVLPPQLHADERREHAGRHDQDDRERQRPALVLRGQHQEDEQHAEREDVDRRVAGWPSAGRRARSIRRRCRRGSVLLAISSMAVERLAGRDAGRGDRPAAAPRSTCCSAGRSAGRSRRGSRRSVPSGTSAPVAERTLQLRDVLRSSAEALRRPARAPGRCGRRR